VQRPERTLPRRRLGGEGQRDRAPVAGAQREVAEGHPQDAGLAQPLRDERAARAREVGVEQHERGIRPTRPAQMVVGAQRRDRGAAEVGAHRRATLSP
jgi:hypothetical protein